MQRVSNGYTIIEVILFLAISGAILLSSLLFLSGRLGTNRFAQSMRDIQSSTQDWINDVATGFPGGSSADGTNTSQCIKAGVRPQIDRRPVPPTPPIPNADAGECIFLGKVIHFTDSTGPPTTGQESKVYIYSVFGIRSMIDSSGEERQTANIVEAHPVPANGRGTNGNSDLTESYIIKGGARVLSVSSDGTVPDSHIAGFFLSLNQGVASRNGAKDVRAYQYPIPGNLAPANTPGPTGGPADECMSLATTSACQQPVGTPDDQWPPPLQNWRICLGDDDPNNRAVLTISSSNGVGAATKLEFKYC